LTAVSTHRSPGPQLANDVRKPHILQQRFATKTGLAKGMLQSAISAGIQPAWFVLEVYSRDASRSDGWSKRRQPYVLTVNRRQPTPINFKLIMPEDLLVPSHPRSWQRRAYRAGTKEKAAMRARVELSCRQPEGFSRWFLLPPS